MNKPCGDQCGIVIGSGDSAVYARKRLDGGVRDGQRVWIPGQGDYFLPGHVPSDWDEADRGTLEDLARDHDR
jgi:hypothetical protein